MVEGRATGAKQNKILTYLLTSQAASNLDPTERAFIMFSTARVIPWVLIQQNYVSTVNHLG